ncbi:MAG: 16S rRNA (guanine(966)-N(2))-methyltransferase RsmD [Mollicutes bacterium]|nr:16S rRNA (guanine(966)-N(2))-methyltransferase RsmD [Mollicutes bacterium]
MRVISGKYKRRNLKGINIKGTRPTMDRVKESMFALIQSKLKDSVCLDLFAGSGSLGIEALGNGADACYFVDIKEQAIKTIKENIDNLKIEEKYYILKKDYQDALKYFYQNKIKFDLIFLDPPYHLNLINHVLELIIKYDLLKENGLVICEFENEIVNNENFICEKERKYSSKHLKILKRK